MASPRISDVARQTNELQEDINKLKKTMFMITGTLAVAIAVCLGLCVL